MRAHLTNGFVEMKRTSAAEVQAAMLSQAEMVARLEADQRHFAGALAESMNEVTMPRNRYHDFEEKEEGEYEEYEDDGLHQWYEVAGVGDMEYQDRVQKAAAPLARVQDPQTAPPDIVHVARKAAHAAAIERSINHKVYEKLSVHPFPRSGDMTNWIYSLGIATVCSGNIGDEQEVIWLRECWTKSFAQLEQSELDGSTSEEWRWKRLDFALSRALQGMIKASGESLSEDVTLRAHEYQQRSMILRGRQIIWMMIDYFKTNRSLQEQYTWQVIELLQWQGDDKFQWFYFRWKNGNDKSCYYHSGGCSAGYVPRENSQFQKTSS